eukprot:9911677-Prorocentrum_lima.AAC.1
MLQEPQEGWDPAVDDMETGATTEVAPHMSANAPPFMTAAEKLREELIQRIKERNHAAEPTVNQILDPNVAPAARLKKA